MKCYLLGQLIIILQIVTAQVTVTLVPLAATVFEGSGAFVISCNVTAGFSELSVTSLIFLLNGRLPLTEMEQTNGIFTDFISETQTDLSIEARRINNNTRITCQAVLSVGGEPPRIVNSPPRVFLVQGVLLPPSQLAIAPVDAAPYFRRLSWNPPFTLDVTNVDPDLSFRICFILQSVTLMCTMTSATSYQFLNFMVSLQIIVRALNAPGESGPGIIGHQGCEGMYNYNEYQVVFIAFILHQSG